MKLLKWALLAFSFNIANASAASYVSKNFTILRALDKVTGRYTNLEVPVGGSAKFGSLSIIVRTCKATPPEEAPENVAFLDITDIKEGKEPQSVFRGWMFSSSPALSAMENPIYDIWVIKCEDRENIKVNPEATQYQGVIVEDNRPKVLEEIDVSGKKDVKPEAKKDDKKVEAKGFLSDVKLANPDDIKASKPTEEKAPETSIKSEDIPEGDWVDSEAQTDDEANEAPMPKSVDKLAEPAKEDAKAPTPVNLDDEKSKDEVKNKEAKVVTSTDDAKSSHDDDAKDVNAEASTQAPDDTKPIVLTPPKED